MTLSLTPSRRRMLGILGGAALALPSLAAPRFVTAAGAPARGPNVLVLVELAGGNDGLNTVIPIRDPRYRALRPGIGIPSSRTLTVDRDTGLHPSLGAFAKLWQAGDLQIVEGVGYPNPNRSHFRSIEIWNAGGGADDAGARGWVSHAFDGKDPQPRDLDGLVLGGDMGPLRGPGRFSAMRDGDSFADVQDQLAQLQDPGHPVRPQAGTNAALDHVLRSYDSARVTGDTILSRLDRSPARRLRFPDTDLGQQLRTAARLLEAGVSVPVMKVVQHGYDTHEAQPLQHADLLSDLSEALNAFADALQTIGLWNAVTVVTYSEFGRTPHENASGGTDHGTAAPLFVAGGSVAGGLGGARPSLEAMKDGALVHTTDYRQVYDGLLRDLWGITGGFAPGAAPPLRLLKV